MAWMDLDSDLVLAFFRQILWIVTVLSAIAAATLALALALLAAARFYGETGRAVDQPARSKVAMSRVGLI